ncbi:hypothetical protein KY345_03030 [Candidatus Woesearchaeota archaeon]|nr:hypothetical protein [Candidatus Woesearchaeota archaeon]
MTVISVNLSKINVERKETPKEKVSINNNIRLKDVEKMDLSGGTAKQDGVKFLFELLVNYEPKFANMNILGEVIYLDTNANVKQIVEGWKKNKNIKKEVFEQVMNAAMNKANIQALIVSQMVNLPAPIQLPKLAVKKE